MRYSLVIACMVAGLLTTGIGLLATAVPCTFIGLGLFVASYALPRFVEVRL